MYNLCGGVGISTASGIPDYRSETGLYAAKGLNKSDMFRDFYNMPNEFWGMAHELFAPGKFQPCLTHSFLRLLERRKVFAQLLPCLCYAARCLCNAARFLCYAARCLWCANLSSLPATRSRLYVWPAPPCRSLLLASSWLSIHSSHRYLVRVCIPDAAPMLHSEH